MNNNKYTEGERRENYIYIYYLVSKSKHITKRNTIKK